VSLTLPPLHVYTLLQMSAVSAFTMALALAAMRPQQREGIGLWAWGLVAYGVAYSLFVLRGQIPDWASVVLANALLSVTLALLLGAVHQFHRRPPPWRAMAVPVLASTIFMVVLLADPQWRSAATNAIAALQIAAVIWALWWPERPQPTRGAMLITVGLVPQMLVLAVRAAVGLAHGMPNPGTMQGGIVQAVVFFSAYVVIILVSLGFVLMTKDRVDAANVQLATTDALTGVANRRALIQALDRDMALAARTQEAYAVLMLDIDHFKTVNDQHGHLVGDRVLCHLADVLRQRLRAQDMLGRYGGEEFLILLPNTSAPGALELAQALRQAVEQTPCVNKGQVLPLTVSIGVCAAVLEPGDGWDQLIHVADQALYQAKQGGRNRVEFGPLPRHAGPETLPHAVF